MRIHAIRMAAIAIGAALLGGASPALANQGTAVIDAKAPGSVTLGGIEYRLSESTTIEDADGNTITYAQLPTLAGGASADDAAAWFEASDGSTQPVLYRLRLTGGLPD